ncbi:MAG TPA: hypothetical protein VF157_07130, partial [Chloroflexota bacterium]
RRALIVPAPNPSVAFGLFDDRAAAETALAALREAGFSADQAELTDSDESSLFDCLLDLAIDEGEARHYQRQVREGKLLVTIISMRRAWEAAELLREYGQRIREDVYSSAIPMGETR